MAIDQETGGVSAQVPDFPDHDTEVMASLLVFASYLRLELNRKIQFTVSFPDYGEAGLKVGIVSDD